MNKVVARYTDGRLLKGSTTDFSASRSAFHITETTAADPWLRTKVLVEDLKALFFVRSFAGNPDHRDLNTLREPLQPGEHAVAVTFSDGEVIAGTTPRFRVAGAGFFLVPFDRESNNERLFVVEASTMDICPV